MNDLVVKMTASTPATVPQQTYLLPIFHFLTAFNKNLMQMTISGLESLTVVDLHKPAVFAFVTSFHDHARGRDINGRL